MPDHEVAEIVDGDLHVSPRPRGRKMPVYAREGVRHLWLANPLSRTLEVYGLAEGRWVLLATHVGSLAVRAQPFTEVELDLAPLWGEG